MEHDDEIDKPGADGGRNAAIQSALHDLCQPLTALQCRLEMGRMAAGRDGLRDALEGGLEETHRLFAAVARLRSCLLEEDGAIARTLASGKGGQAIQ